MYVTILPFRLPLLNAPLGCAGDSRGSLPPAADYRGGVQRSRAGGKGRLSKMAKHTHLGAPTHHVEIPTPHPGTHGAPTCLIITMLDALLPGGKVASFSGCIWVLHEPRGLLQQIRVDHDFTTIHIHALFKVERNVDAEA
jgi:hypothetical protein